MPYGLRVLRNMICRFGRRVRTIATRRYWTDERIHRSGMDLINEINRRRPENSIIVFAGPNMGDVFYTMAFVKTFHEQNPEKRVIVLTLRAFAEQFLPAYSGYDTIVVINKRQWSRFAQLGFDLEVSRLGYGSNIVFVQCFANFEPEHLSVIWRLRNLAFRVGDNAPIQYHLTAPPPPYGFLYPAI